MPAVFSCNCCVTQGEIRYCSTLHEYIHVPTNRKLTSVSEIIRTVYAKKSWDGVDETVVANARVRGEAVDRYMAEYIHSGTVTLPDYERDDVHERMTVAHRLWEKYYGHAFSVIAQCITYSLQDGIAGMADFIVNDECIVDLKCTYSPEVSWLLQLGAYASYWAACSSVAVIHVSPKLYRDGGRVIDYDVTECRALWADAVNWWKRMKEAEFAFKKIKGSKTTATRIN